MAQLGINLGSGLATTSIGGVSTPVYFTNLYLFSFLWPVKFSQSLGAKVIGAYGLGGGYGIKGIREMKEDVTETVTKDTDIIFGPAFRVGWAWDFGLYAAFDFIIGLTQASPFGAYGDEGSFAIGWQW